MVTVIVAIYYNVIIAYSLYYMFASFQSPLPWSGCSSWADSNCTDTATGACLTSLPIHALKTLKHFNNSYLIVSALTFPVICNASDIIVINGTQENSTCPPSGLLMLQSPSEQYWE